MAVRFDIRCRDGLSCYTALMTYNAILTIECLVKDFLLIPESHPAMRRR